MSVSAHQDLPATRRPEQLELQPTEEQKLVIQKAAELLGWTVSDYVLCAALDRAERDLYEHAAMHGFAQSPPGDRQDSPGALPDSAAEPIVALVSALG